MAAGLLILLAIYHGLKIGVAANPELFVSDPETGIAISEQLQPKQSADSVKSPPLDPLKPCLMRNYSPEECTRAIDDYLNAPAPH